MSLSKQQGAEEAIEESGDGFGGSPLYSNMELDLHHLPSPQSWDLCLSPLWNFGEDCATSQSYFTGTTCGLSVKDLPQSLSYELESYESPADNYDKRGPSSPICSLKCRISQALRYLKGSMVQHCLAQVWIPVKRESRYLLSTSEAPFVLDYQSYGLSQYRMVSSMYNFCVDDESDDLGLPGRVFRTKLPEWSPNVQYYSSAEYPLLNHALHYNICGTLALPLFEPGGCCVGVLELIMTSQKINYAQEIDLICKAVEAVELRTELFHLPRTQVLSPNENQQNALVEILEVLTVVSETYRLPLAQTWTFCSHCNFSTSGGSLHRSCCYKVCMCLCDFAFYVVDAHVWGFREASVEHHLVEGQGVIGKAFSTLNLCFCRDITQFCKAEYPLVHYARMFGLQSCLAVPVGNCRTANDIYILEFFLPPQLTDFESQKKLLASLSKTIRKSLKNLRIVSHKVFGEERDIEIINFPSEEKLVLDPEHYERSQSIRCEYGILEHNQTFITLGSTHMTEASQTGKEMLKSDVVDGEIKTHKGQGNVSVTVPGKEVKVTLDILQQLYGRSLQDAAECLGVSRSTIKRICRKLGITRWPSHKREKISSFSHLNESITSISTFRHRFPHHTQPEELVGRFPSKKSTVKYLEPREGFLCKKSSTAVKDLEEVKKQELDSTRLLPSSNLALNQVKNVENVATGPRTRTAATAPSEWSLPINARYQQKTVKFLLHFPLKMIDLEKELAEMLKLKLGTFMIKYLDTENDWILIACDDDLQDLAVVSGLTCDGTIQMIVQKIHNTNY